MFLKVALHYNRFVWIMSSTQIKLNGIDHQWPVKPCLMNPELKLHYVCRKAASFIAAKSQSMLSLNFVIPWNHPRAYYYLQLPSNIGTFSTEVQSIMTALYGVYSHKVNTTNRDNDMYIHTQTHTQIYKRICFKILYVLSLAYHIIISSSFNPLWPSDALRRRQHVV